MSSSDGNRVPCPSQAQRCLSGKSRTRIPTRAMKQKLKLPQQNLRRLPSPSSAKIHQVTSDLSCSGVTQGCLMPLNLPLQSCYSCRRKTEAAVRRSRTLPFIFLQGDREMLDSLTRIAELVCASHWVFSPLSCHLGAELAL